MHTSRFVLASLPALPQTAAPSISDEQLWSSFVKWVDGLKQIVPARGAPYVSFNTYYENALVAEGISREEARRRSARITAIRRSSTGNERIYWDGAFKVGGGPSNPLRLLKETIRDVKAGRALDAGMGRGRNTIFLAANGWDAYGYDMAPEGIKAAHAAAREEGVRITTYVAKHEDFDFGEAGWDLILCSYNSMEATDPHWPGVFLKALKPGGKVIFQTTVQRRTDWTKLSGNWKSFHILRLEDEDPGRIDDDWGPSKTNRTIRLVVRKV
jgi:SAM-dependent methyltransferase